MLEGIQPTFESDVSTISASRRNRLASRAGAVDSRNLRIHALCSTMLHCAAQGLRRRLRTGATPPLGAGSIGECGFEQLLGGASCRPAAVAPGANPSMQFAPLREAGAVTS